MSYDPFVKPDYEHYEGESTGQETVTSITGTVEVAPSLEHEVQTMVMERHMVDVADKQLRAAIVASNKTGLTRVVAQGGELILKSVYCPANVATMLVAYNFNRSQVIVSGNNVDVAIGSDPGLNNAGGTTVPPMNAVYVGFVGTAFVREFRTMRDLWAISSVNTWLGVQEEFFVS